MYQLLIAPMQCPVCGTVTKDGLTDMQLKPLPSASDPPRTIAIGDRFPMGFDQVATSGFRIVRQPPSPTAFRLLQPWRCPQCGTEDQWAIVEFATDGTTATLRSVTPAPKSKHTLAQVDAVSRLLDGAI
jgi:hypothetical protein